MGSPLRLLLIVMLFWCGLHAAAPAWAHEEARAVQFAGASDELPADRDAPGEPAHAGHHHCPVAPDPCAGNATGVPVARTSSIFPPRAAPLRSHAQAPPLQPPAA